jgi:hypothetical protein
MILQNSMPTKREMGTPETADALLAHAMDLQATVNRALVSLKLPELTIDQFAQSVSTPGLQEEGETELYPAYKRVLQDNLSPTLFICSENRLPGKITLRWSPNGASINAHACAAGIHFSTVHFDDISELATLTDIRRNRIRVYTVGSISTTETQVLIGPVEDSKYRNIVVMAVDPQNPAYVKSTIMKIDNDALTLVGPDGVDPKAIEALKQAQVKGKIEGKEAPNAQQKLITDIQQLAKKVGLELYEHDIVAYTSKLPVAGIENYHMQYVLGKYGIKYSANHILFLQDPSITIHPDESASIILSAGGVYFDFSKLIKSPAPEGQLGIVNTIKQGEDNALTKVATFIDEGILGTTEFQTPIGHKDLTHIGKNVQMNGEKGNGDVIIVVITKNMKGQQTQIYTGLVEIPLGWDDHMKNDRLIDLTAFEAGSITHQRVDSTAQGLRTQPVELDSNPAGSKENPTTPPQDVILKKVNDALAYLRRGNSLQIAPNDAQQQIAKINIQPAPSSNICPELKTVLNKLCIVDPISDNTDLTKVCVQVYGEGNEVTVHLLRNGYNRYLQLKYNGKRPGLPSYSYNITDIQGANFGGATIELSNQILVLILKEHGYHAPDITTVDDRENIFSQGFDKAGRLLPVTQSQTPKTPPKQSFMGPAPVELQEEQEIYDSHRFNPSGQSVRQRDEDFRHHPQTSTIQRPPTPVEAQKAPSPTRTEATPTKAFPQTAQVYPQTTPPPETAAERNLRVQREQTEKTRLLEQQRLQRKQAEQQRRYDLIKPTLDNPVSLTAQEVQYDIDRPRFLMWLENPQTVDLSDCIYPNKSKLRVKTIHTSDGIKIELKLDGKVIGAYGYNQGETPPVEITSVVYLLTSKPGKKVTSSPPVNIPSQREDKTDLTAIQKSFASTSATPQGVERRTVTPTSKPPTPTHSTAPVRETGGTRGKRPQREGDAIVDEKKAYRTEKTQRTTANKIKRSKAAKQQGKKRKG